MTYARELAEALSQLGERDKAISAFVRLFDPNKENVVSAMVEARAAATAAHELATLREACDEIRAALIAVGRQMRSGDLKDAVLEQADQLVMVAHPIRVVSHRER